MHPWSCASLIIAAGAIGGFVNAPISNNGFVLARYPESVQCLDQVQAQSMVEVRSTYLCLCEGESTYGRLPLPLHISCQQEHQGMARPKT